MRNELRALRVSAALCFVAVAAASCGARTDLPVEKRAVPCVDGEFTLRPGRAEVLFVIDRSGSMALGIAGEPPIAGELSRWELLRRAMQETLGGFSQVAMGAKLFPQAIPRGVIDVTPQIGCALEPGIDLVPRFNNLVALDALFASSDPRGGTPTAPALDEARKFLLPRRSPGLSQNIVLTTDGGPNCNADTGVPASLCVCTSTPEACSASPSGPYNCLDDVRTIASIRGAAEAGIPVYVVGIEDPTRPELGDAMDRLALAGGRPRSSGTRRFYNVREAVQLTEALHSIVQGIARCELTLASVPDSDDGIEVNIDGVSVPRDPARQNGWDWLDRDAGRIGVFGAACDQLSAGGKSTASVRCG